MRTVLQENLNLGLFFLIIRLNNLTLVPWEIITRCFQDTYNNMPFQSWEIRPYGEGCVIFTLIAASVELEISIKENACCLNSPEDMELDGIRNKWLPAHILMQKLVAAGINVFPSEDADKYVSISVKVRNIIIIITTTLSSNESWFNLAGS